MTYYTALDVSLRFVSICIVDDTGQVQHEAKVPAHIDKIVDCLRKFSDEVKIVGFEAGALTQYLTYGLQAAGFEVICLEARQVNAALAAMRNKTDRNDARGIAQILPAFTRDPIQPFRKKERRTLRDSGGQARHGGGSS